VSNQSISESSLLLVMELAKHPFTLPVLVLILIYPAVYKKIPGCYGVVSIVDQVQFSLVKQE
jgi:hypothetical protein